MAYAYVQTPGNGTNRAFSVPFPFIVRAHVRVYLGYDVAAGTGTELVDGIGFSWLSSTQIQTTVAPAVGTTLTVIRKTPNGSQLVVWATGSPPTQDELNTADLQSLYVIQEQADLTASAVTTAATAAAAANAAVAAVAAALPYQPIAAVANIPASPTASQRIEISNTTGLGSFSPLSGKPAGFVGGTDVKARLIYGTPTAASWNWVDYFPVDPDGRYATITAATDAQATANRRNRIINGNFAVLQRGNPFSVSGSYGADRWFTNWAGSGYIQFGSTTITAPAGFRESGFISYISGTVTDATFVQRIESANCKDLVSGGQITISFWAFTNKAGGWTPIYELRFPNAADYYTATTAIISATSLSAIAANTWTKLTVTVTLSGTPSNGLELTIHSGVMASGENRLITGVQLEPGPVATPFEQRPIGTELALCQRYFQWAPFNQGFSFPFQPGGGAGLFLVSTVTWPVTMRATPTVAPLTADPNTPQYSQNAATKEFQYVTPYGASAVLQPLTSGDCVVEGYRSALSAEL